MNTSYPTAISREIEAIEIGIKSCFDNDAPIDPKQVKRLCDLRVERLQELAAKQREVVAGRNKREEIMKTKTRELTAKVAQINFRAKPDIEELVCAEMARYDSAAILWLDGVALWEESDACSIAAGILILATGQEND